MIISMCDEFGNYVGYMSLENFEFLQRATSRYRKEFTLYKLFDRFGKYIQNTTDIVRGLEIMKYQNFFNKGVEKNSLEKFVKCCNCENITKVFSVNEIIEPYICYRCSMLKLAP